MEIYKKLFHIQQNLKAPKDQFNSFGGYKYRSCEGILEAVKPYLADTGTVLTLSDTIEEHGGRVYVKACAKLTDIENPIHFVEVSASAREEETKKGMDASQVTGAASSYARKYALNGLFDIDDNKDSDATNTHGKENAGTTAHPSAGMQGGGGNGYTPKCAACGAKITDAEHDFSVKKYKKPLCRACQKKENSNA